MKKLKITAVLMIILICLSHLPYIGGNYGGALPYHPFRLFSADADEIASLEVTDGYGGFLAVDDREELEDYCEQLSSFRYVLFVPDLLPRRGHSSAAVKLVYPGGAFQYVYIRPWGFYRSHVGWYIGFGGGTKELMETAAALR